jgi:bifunctional ADP-heptose synthase (sugar kinase/adenylyltransferase)
VSAGPLVVVGDVLLDREVLGTVERLCPEAPVPVLAETSTLDRPGGAGLAAVLAATADGPQRWSRPLRPDSWQHCRPWDEVMLIGAFSADHAGVRLRELLAGYGVRVVALPAQGPTAEKIRLRSGRHLLLRLDRGDHAASIGDVPSEAYTALRAAGTVLVSDYGRGVAAHPQLTGALARQADRIPLVWDPHPKGARPVPGCRLVTPNRGEAAGFVAACQVPPSGTGQRTAAADAASLCRHWSVGAVAVTLAERGAVLCEGDQPPRLVPAPFAAHGDACGAGDRFASAVAAALAAGASMIDSVRAAVNAATAYVATDGALAMFPEQSDTAATEMSTRSN